MFANPGFSDEVFRKLYIRRHGIKREENRSYRFCRHCEIIREPRVEHCSMCGLCVHDIDHHCVFFGNCIARDNLSSFHGSIGCLLISVIFFMVMTMSDGVAHSKQSYSHHRYSNDTHLNGTTYH